MFPKPFKVNNIHPQKKEMQRHSFISVKKIPENYKAKCKYMKHRIKSLMFENAALCDEIAHIQEKTLLVTEEKNFLFKKLQMFQPLAETEAFRAPVGNGLDPSKKSAKKRTERSTSNISDSSDPSKVVKPVKKPPVPRKKKTVRPAQADSNGRPFLPIALGDATVHTIGEVCDKNDYFTEDLIFPVGFCSTRIYGSLKNPEKQCVYTCKILDGGQSPRFEIVADTELDIPIVSSSIDHCHSLLLNRINACLATEVVNTRGRGADFFGISHPTIHQLIQSLPGVRRCKGYIWTKFESNPNFEYTTSSEASLSYSALLRSISFSKSHLESMIKPDSFSEYPEDVNVLRNILLNQ